MEPYQQLDKNYNNSSLWEGGVAAGNVGWDFFRKMPKAEGQHQSTINTLNHVETANHLKKQGETGTPDFRK